MLPPYNNYYYPYHPDGYSSNGYGIAPYWMRQSPPRYQEAPKDTTFIELHDITEKNHQLKTEIETLKQAVASAKTNAMDTRQDYRKLYKSQQQQHKYQHQAMRYETQKSQKNRDILNRETKHLKQDAIKQYREQQKEHRRLLKEKLEWENKVAKTQKQEQRKLDTMLMRLGVLPKDYLRTKHAEERKAKKAERKAKKLAKKLAKKYKNDPAFVQATAQSGATQTFADSSKPINDLGALNHELRKEQLEFNERHSRLQPRRDPGRPLWDRMIYADNGKVRDGWKPNLFLLSLPISGLLLILGKKGGLAKGLGQFFGTIGVLGSILSVFFNKVRELGFADWTTRTFTGNLDKYENADFYREEYLRSALRNEFGMPHGD